MPDYSFGERMRELRAERGTKPPGRRPIRDKHGRYVAATEATFAKAMPDNAEAYVAALKGEAPERCPQHDRVLTCADCGHQSERTYYDHRSAQYLFDRILGRPTSRSENSLTVALVSQLASVFADAFAEVNVIEDAAERREAFANRLSVLEGQLNGGGGW